MNWEPYETGASHDQHPQAVEQMTKLTRINEILHTIGAANMRVAANGPSVSIVIDRALMPRATEADIRHAKTIASMAINQFRIDPDHAGLVDEAKTLLSTLIPAK